MKCINKSCKGELEAGAEFCPFCGTNQTQAMQADPFGAERRQLQQV